MTFDPARLAERLRSLRAERNLDQKDVAIGAGVSGSSISYWEAGEKMPSAGGVARLAVFYGVSADFLLGISDARIGVPAGAYIIDEDMRSALLRAKSRADVDAAAGWSIEQPIDGSPPRAVRDWTWFIEVPRRARIVSPGECEHLRSKVTENLVAVNRASRKGGP